MTLLTPLALDSVSLLEFIDEIATIEQMLESSKEYLSKNYDQFNPLEKMITSGDSHRCWHFDINGLFQKHSEELTPSYQLIRDDIKPELQTLQKLLKKHITKPDQVKVGAHFLKRTKFKKRWLSAIYEFNVTVVLEIVYAHEPREYFTNQNAKEYVKAN